MMNCSMFLRLFKKNSIQNWISILGLAIGVTCFVLGFYWYRYETSYDNFQKDYKRIHYIYSRSISGNFDWNATNGGLAMFLSGYPEIESATSLENSGNFFNDFRCCYASDTVKTLYYGIDSSFDKVFTLDLIAGKQLNFSGNTDVLFTESYARRIFGKDNPIGKTVKLMGYDIQREFTVCGIVKDYPSNSNLKFDVLIAKKARDYDSWGMRSFYTFLKVRPGVNADRFMQKIKRGLEDALESGEKIEYRTVSINSMRIDFKAIMKELSGYDYEKDAKLGLSREVIQLFALASILVLFASLLNFIMLQTTLFFGRKKEVTLRSVLGASRMNIIKLFARDLLLFSLIALLISVCLTELIMPYWTDYVETTLVSHNLHATLVATYIVVCLIIACAGAYPALRLTRRDIYKRLKGENYSKWSRYLGSSMIFVQLVIACFILFFAFIIKGQMNYVKNTDLGLNIDHVYTIKMSTPALSGSYREIMNEIRNNPNIDLVTNYRTNRIFGQKIDKLMLPNGEYCNIQEVNYDFVNLFDIKMRSGRFYSTELGDKGYNGDYLNLKGTSDAIVMNEKAAALLGKKDVVGSDLGQFGRIIGIMENYHALSLREDILPMVFMLNHENEENYFISMKVRPGYEKKLNSYLESVLKRHDPSIVYEPAISLKRVYDSMYDSETKIMHLLDIICVLSLIISAFGIYALALLAVKKRRKETAVRKVLGAEVKQIVYLFFKEYIVLILLANIVALPLAYSVSQRWLSGFAYHIPVHVGYFVLTVLVGALVILITVFGQIWKVSWTNPAEVVKE